MLLNVFPVFHAAEPDVTAALYLKVTVEMLDGTDKPFAFFHIRTCPEHNGPALFAAAELCMGLVGVAPGSTPVYESLELPRYVSPVGGRNTDNDIGFFKFGYDIAEIVALDALSSVMTASAALAEAEMEVVDTHGRDLKAAGQLFCDNTDYF